MVKFHFLICVLLFSSCCHEYDSRVAKGYPYGNAQELSYMDAPSQIPKDFDMKKISEVMNNHHIEYFSNKDTCEKILRLFDPNCSCDGIDFKKFGLTYFLGETYSVNEGLIQPRLFINHKTKEYYIELRGYVKSCNNGTEQIFNYRRWHLIPKPPEGYQVMRRNIPPIQ